MVGVRQDSFWLEFCQKVTHTKVFFKQLIAHGYKGNEIRCLFHKAIDHAKTYSGLTTEDEMGHNVVILHLHFHQNDPAAFCIQEAWRKHVAKPQ